MHSVHLGRRTDFFFDFLVIRDRDRSIEHLIEDQVQVPCIQEGFEQLVEDELVLGQFPLEIKVVVEGDNVAKSEQIRNQVGGPDEAPGT